MRAIAVRSQDLEEWRDRLEWHFDSFCRDGSINPGGLWADLEDETRQLWIVEDETGVLIAVLTAISKDNYKTCDLTHGAGRDREKWQHLLGIIENWARNMGCERFRITARWGWQRTEAFKAFKKTHVVLERVL